MKQDQKVLKEEEKARAIIAAVLDEASPAQREAMFGVPPKDIRLACAAYQLGLDVGVERVLQHVRRDEDRKNELTRNRSGIGNFFFRGRWVDCRSRAANRVDNPLVFDNLNTKEKRDGRKTTTEKLNLSELC